MIQESDECHIARASRNLLCVKYCMKGEKKSCSLAYVFIIFRLIYK